MDKPNISYEEICRVIGHVILSSRSEILSMDANFSVLIQQMKDKIDQLQEENMQLRNKDA